LRLSFDPNVWVYIAPIFAAIIAQVASRRAGCKWTTIQLVGIFSAVATGAFQYSASAYLAEIEYAPLGVSSWLPALFCAGIGAVVGLGVGIPTVVVFPLIWIFMDWLAAPRPTGESRKWLLPLALLSAFAAMTFFYALIALHES
jgi:hypothetical protein